MKGRSTNTNLFSLTRYISDTLDDQGLVDFTYTDMTKAFDHPYHDILDKFDRVGVSDKLGLFLQQLETI